MNSCSAQLRTANLPDKVEKAFATLYPAVPVRRWLFKDSVYTTLVTYNNHNTIASFHSDGEWIRTETTIRKSRHLPANVKEGLLNSQFAQWYVETMQKEETAKDTVYRIIVDNGNLLDGDHLPAFFVKYRLDFLTSGDLRRIVLLP